MTPRFHMQNLEPSQLARLLAVDDLAADNWARDDAAAILRHQLAAPLLPDLLLVPGAEEPRLRALQNRPGAASFLDQLTCLHPSLELLQAIKAFARHVHADPANPLHASPADVLYYAAIAAALLRCDERITRLSDAELAAGLTWAISQKAAAPLRHILQAALDHLAS